MGFNSAFKGLTEARKTSAGVGNALAKGILTFAEEGNRW